ncbi:MAG: hypothetical protein Q9228_003380 [Teloschistes exilis]
MEVDDKAGAPPLSGSTLLANEEKHESSRPAPASCGNWAIDTGALDGGFRYGEITSIAGAKGTGKTLFAFHAIASHLLAHESGEVVLIATSDIHLPRLRDVLISRLERHDRGPEFQESGYVYSKQSARKQPSPDLAHRVTSMLERIRLCRVFDFPGVAEAVAEFTTSLEENDRRDQEAFDAMERKMKGIPDSEDEDEDSDALDFEEHAAAKPKSFDDQDRNRLRQPASANMIVVDNMASVVGSMMAKSQVQGHAMLATFMQSLQHLTHRRHVCTLVINSVVGLRLHGVQHPRRLDDHVSIFASTLGKPALGKHFANLIDTSIFLSTVPKGREDADIAYGDGQRPRRFDEAGVIEVVKDRKGTREGIWRAFVIERGFELQSTSL